MTLPQPVSAPRESGDTVRLALTCAAFAHTSARAQRSDLFAARRRNGRSDGNVHTWRTARLVGRARPCARWKGLAERRLVAPRRYRYDFGAMSALELAVVLIPAVMVGIALLFWEGGDWAAAAAGLGLVGLSICAWVDAFDGCPRL